MKVEVNFENEFKIGIKCTGHQAGNEPEVLNELWTAYLAKRFEESESAVPLPVIHRANGRSVKSPFSQEVKGYRVREFSIAADGKHPGNVEIRQETGAKPKTMIKIGNGAGPDRPALSREEYMIRNFPAPFEMGNLPKAAREPLAEAFERAQVGDVIPALQSESFRHKTIVHAVVEDPQLGSLECDIELAKDIGAGCTIAGQIWDINEVEGEVKAVRICGQGVDIKEDPEQAGITKDDVRVICDRVLAAERTEFLEFAQAFLQERNLAQAVQVFPVYHAKSRPGIDLLSPLLRDGGDVARTAVAAVKERGFHVVPELAELARQRAVEARSAHGYAPRDRPPEPIAA
ncbi:MAG: hypothetical protein EOM26_05740 [Alphaproteobacteria bacterium]|nr:hypothetical protein [Alphaproteobacteria bacterium]